MMKPFLTLHPGFPKCATSSLQRAFVLNDHRLATQLDVQFLGRDFLPNNGYPEVIKLMDNPAVCAAQVRATDYAPGHYFLSNEAVNTKEDFLAALREKFTIKQVVFTIRLPVLQAVSQYRFSGWTKTSFVAASEARDTNFLNAQTRLARKIDWYSAYDVPIVLCPLEGRADDILVRFCQAGFGRVPDAAAKIPDRRVNSSIGLAFAEALFHELSAKDIIPVDTAMRRALVRAAKKYDLDPALQTYATEDLAMFLENNGATLCSDYRALLEKHGVPEDIADAAVEVGADSIHKLCELPVASMDVEHTLREHARAVIKQAQASLIDS